MPPALPPCHFPLHFEEAVTWDGTGTPVPPVPLPKARFKELRSIGHKLDQFLAARVRWTRRASEAGSVPAWVRGLDSSTPGKLGDEGLFATGLTILESGFRSQPLVFPHSTAARLSQLWSRMDPDAPASLPPPCEVPDDANAPLWVALLRLAPLRDFWDRELRRATVDTLLNLIPDAWVLNPERVPEGAVIPRLNLASWDDLPKRRSNGHAFAIATAHTEEQLRVLDPASPAEDWSAATQEALVAFHEDPRVLTDLGPYHSGKPPLIVAFYQKAAGRVDYLGAMALAYYQQRLDPARVAIV